MQTVGVKLHALDLGRYGKTPSGLPLWRIVWSDSRTNRMEYEGKVSTVLFYSLIKESWVLERWRSPREAMGMTRREYEELFEGVWYGKPKFPYPEDGEYEGVTYWSGDVDHSLILKLVERHVWEHNNLTSADRKARNEAQSQAEEAQKKEAVKEGLGKIMGAETTRNEVDYQGKSFSLPETPYVN